MTVVADLDRVTSADAFTVSWLAARRRPGPAHRRALRRRHRQRPGRARCCDSPASVAGSTSSALPARAAEPTRSTTGRAVRRTQSHVGGSPYPLPSAMPTRNERTDVAVLLRTEHAVARVLASAPDEDDAHPRLLAAIGEALALGLRRPVDADRRRRLGPALRAHLGERLAPTSPPSPRPSRSVTLAAGAGPARRGVADGPAGVDRRRRRASAPAAALAGRRRRGPALRLRLPDPRQRGGPRRHGVLRRRARRARRGAAGHRDQPRLADRAVRGPLPRRAGRARERGAQDRDPQRRLRLHRHDGRRREHRRGQRRHRDDLRLQRRGDGRPRAGRAHDPARQAARGPPPRAAALHGAPAPRGSSATRSSSRPCAPTAARSPSSWP